MFKPFMMCGTAVFHCKNQLIIKKKKVCICDTIKNNPQPQRAATWQQYSPNSTHILSHTYIQPLYSKYAQLVVSTLIILKI